MHSMPSPCTAFSQSLSVNSLQWRIQGDQYSVVSLIRKALFSAQVKNFIFIHLNSFYFLFLLYKLLGEPKNFAASEKLGDSVDPVHLYSMKLYSSSCFLFRAWRGQLHNLKSTTWQYLSVCPTTVNGIRLQVNTPRKRNHVRRSMSWIKLFRNWGLSKVNVIHSTLGEWPTVFGRLY